MAQASFHEAAVSMHRALSVVGLRTNVEGYAEGGLHQELAREAAKAIYGPVDAGYIKRKGPGTWTESVIPQRFRERMEETKGRGQD